MLKKFQMEVQWILVTIKKVNRLIQSRSYAIGWVSFWLFIFRILDFKNRIFRENSKHLWLIGVTLFAKELLRITWEDQAYQRLTLL